MTSDITAAGEPAGNSDDQEPNAIDSAIAQPDALTRPAVEWAQQAADAMRPVRDLVQPDRFVVSAPNLQGIWAALESMTERQRKFAEAISMPAVTAAMESVSRSQRKFAEAISMPAITTTIESAAAAAAMRWAETNRQNVARMRENVLAFSEKISPLIIKAAEVAGKKIHAIYRSAAPPNWTADDTTPLLPFPAAIALALEEGIPLAWVPDYDTVKALLAVPSSPDRRTDLRTILADRSTIILDHCQERLDELANDPDATDSCHRMIVVARESIQALRFNLPAPAQSAAANLVDHLLRRLITPIDGKYAYKNTKKRINGLSEVNSMSFSALAMLRELATLMPAPKALTEWWPNQGMPLPDTFSRHATAHAIAERDQISLVNALIAVMFAVSLLCQESASQWAALGSFWNPEPELDDADHDANVDDGTI